MAVKRLAQPPGNAGDRLVSSRDMPVLTGNGRDIFDTIHHVASTPRTFDSWMEDREAWAREVLGPNAEISTEDQITQTDTYYADEFLRRATRIRNALERGETGEAVYLAVKLGHLCGEFDTKIEWEFYVRRGFNNTENGKRGGVPKDRFDARNGVLLEFANGYKEQHPKARRSRIALRMAGCDYEIPSFRTTEKVFIPSLGAAFSINNLPPVDDLPPDDPCQKCPYSHEQVLTLLAIAERIKPPADGNYRWQRKTRKSEIQKRLRLTRES